MEDQLFIPSKIKVGYRERSDTYTKRLAYVIYYDNKGKLRKETSWEGWRDTKIAPDDFDNKPHSGFILNKDVKRCSSYFGNGRNMIRIYDDRGIEFEITTGNLLFILMTTNCHKRGLEGEFVYAWMGKELVLLPCDCDEYRKSNEYTNLQSQKVAAKSLVAGCSYKTKKQEDLIYLGRFDWLDYGYNYGVSSGKKHIFISSSGKEAKDLVSMDSVSSLAAVNSDIPVSNYAELVQVFSDSPRAAKIDSVELSGKPEGDYFYSKAGKGFLQWSKVYCNQDEYRPYQDISLALADETNGLIKRIVCKTNDEYHRYYGYSAKRTEAPNLTGRFELYVILDNGKKMSFEKFTKLVRGY